MKYTLYYPLPAKNDIALQMVPETGVDMAISHIAADTPFCMHDKLRGRIFLLARKQRKIVGAFNVKRGEGRKNDLVTIRLKISNSRAATYWGLGLDVHVPKDVTADLVYQKMTTNGNPVWGEDSDFEAEIAVFEDLLRPIFDARIRIPEHLTLDARTPARSRHIAETLRRMARDLRAGCKAKSAQKAAQAQARQAALNALPDGAPLQVWIDAFSPIWSIGVKRGNIPRSKAHLYNLAGEDLILDPKLVEAGLSRHAAMQMLASLQELAEAALADRDLAAALEIARALPHAKAPLARLHKLSTDNPLHASLQDRSYLSALRSKMPKIWVNSQRLASSTGLNLRIQGHLFDGYIPPTGPRLSLPPQGQPFPVEEVTFLFNRHLAEVKAAPPDLYRSLGCFILSDRLAALLETHDLGRNRIVAYPLADKDSGTGIGKLNVLVLGEDHPATQIPLTSQGLSSTYYPGSTALKDFEMEISPPVREMPDIWTDSRLMGGYLFFSDRLKTSLKGASFPVKLPLKRCTIL